MKACRILTVAMLIAPLLACKPEAFKLSGGSDSQAPITTSPAQGYNSIPIKPSEESSEKFFLSPKGSVANSPAEYVLRNNEEKCAKGGNFQYSDMDNSGRIVAIVICKEYRSNQFRTQESANIFLSIRRLAEEYLQQVTISGQQTGTIHEASLVEFNSAGVSERSTIKGAIDTDIKMEITSNTFIKIDHFSSVLKDVYYKEDKESGDTIRKSIGVFNVYYATPDYIKFIKTINRLSNDSVGSFSGADISVAKSQLSDTQFDKISGLRERRLYSLEKLNSVISKSGLGQTLAVIYPDNINSFNAKLLDSFFKNKIENATIRIIKTDENSRKQIRNLNRTTLYYETKTLPDFVDSMGSIDKVSSIPYFIGKGDSSINILLVVTNAFIEEVAKPAYFNRAIKFNTPMWPVSKERDGDMLRFWQQDGYRSRWTANDGSGWMGPPRQVAYVRDTLRKEYIVVEFLAGRNKNQSKEVIILRSALDGENMFIRGPHIRIGNNTYCYDVRELQLILPYSSCSERR